MGNLHKGNKDYHEIKKKLDEIDYSPVSSISDLKNQNIPDGLKIAATKMLDNAKFNSGNALNMYQVNLFFFQGHGVSYKGDPILLIPDKANPTKLKFFNVENFAKKLASIDKCLSIIIFDACREDIEERYPQFLE